MALPAARQMALPMARQRHNATAPQRHNATATQRHSHEPSVVAASTAASGPAAHPGITGFGREISVRAVARGILARLRETMSGSVATAGLEAAVFAFATAATPTGSTASVSTTRASAALEATFAAAFASAASAPTAPLTHPPFVVNAVVGKEA